MKFSAVAHSIATLFFTPGCSSCREKGVSQLSQLPTTSVRAFAHFLETVSQSGTHRQQLSEFNHLVITKWPEMLRPVTFHCFISEAPHTKRVLLCQCCVVILTQFSLSGDDPITCISKVNIFSSNTHLWIDNRLETDKESSHRLNIEKPILNQKKEHNSPTNHFILRNFVRFE